MVQAIKQFLDEVEKLHERNELSKKVESTYFEPGMMEYLEQSEGIYEEGTGNVILRFEVMGTRYDGRTEQIEKLKPGDLIQIVREKRKSLQL